MVAELPRQRLVNPFWRYVFARKYEASRKENCAFCVWKLIFVRSRGAIVVFAIAPAIAPANSDVMSRSELEIGSVCGFGKE